MSGAPATIGRMRCVTCPLQSRPGSDRCGVCALVPPSPAPAGEPGPPPPRTAGTPGRPSITCRVCGATSHHPWDVAFGYCGACHDYTGRFEPLIKTLFSNEWLSLRMIQDVAAGVHGYVYAHETRCQGSIVAVLPYAYTPEHGRRYLVRSEITPCWSMLPQLSAITGGWEGGEPREDAVRELREESGYEVDGTDLVDLGLSYAGKAADTIYHLFAVDVTGAPLHEPIGDGSPLEDSAGVVWVNDAELAEVMDPQVALMYVRLNR